MRAAPTRPPVHRRIEHILILAMLVGAFSGGVMGALYMVWVSFLSRSTDGSGGWAILAVIVGAAVGLAVAVPTGIVWILTATPDQDALVGARWAAALTAAAVVVALSLVLLQRVGLPALTSALAAAVVAYGWGPRIGIWRSGELTSSSDDRTTR